MNATNVGKKYGKQHNNKGLKIPVSRPIPKEMLVRNVQKLLRMQQKHKNQLRKFSS